MPQRPYIPPAGTPLSPSPGAHREILAGIARAAAKENWLGAGITADDGTLQPPPPVLRGEIALFEITDDFTNGDLPEGQTWPSQPSGDWYWAPTTRVEYYPDTGEWGTPADEGDSATVAQETYVWYNATKSPPPYATGSRVRCQYDDGPGCWVILAHLVRVFAATLSYDLASDDATASVDITGPLDGGPDLDTDPAEVGNTAGWNGSEGDVLVVRTTAIDSDLTASEAWEIISIEHAGGGGAKICWGYIDSSDPGNGTYCSTNTCPAPRSVQPSNTFYDAENNTANSHAVVCVWPTCVPGKWVALFTATLARSSYASVVGYVYDPVTCPTIPRVIITEHHDKKAGTLEYGATCNFQSNIPAGWTDVTSQISGAFPMANTNLCGAGYIGGGADSTSGTLPYYAGDRHTHPEHTLEPGCEGGFMTCPPLLISSAACESCEYVGLTCNHGEAVPVCPSAVDLNGNPHLQVEQSSPCPIHNGDPCTNTYPQSGVLTPNYYRVIVIMRTY